MAHQLTLIISVREIYEILLKLSLLKSEENYNKEIIDNYNELDKNDVFVDVGDFLKKIKPFETWLMDNMISISPRKRILDIVNYDATAAGALLAKRGQKHKRLRIFATGCAA